MNRTQALQQKQFDEQQWQKLYYRHQQQYLRQRLEAIRLLQQGSTRTQVCQELNCTYDTLTSWIDKYLRGGLEQLVSAISHKKPSRLTPEQQQQLKQMVLNQRPTDYGIERNLWTGAILSQVIEQRWGVSLRDSRIYELLHQLELSHQRGHRDYANANAAAQQQWVEAVKKLQSQLESEKIVFFDEFAVYDRPSVFYGWAERNTRPLIPSDERQRHKLNGLLCVDALTGEEFVRLSDKAKTEDISLYLAHLCLDCIELGFNKLSIVLDNNTTHKQKMRRQLAEHLKQMGLADELMVEFIYLPAYSPKLNLVEYVIHLIRLRFLHHLPIGTSLETIEHQLEKFLQSHQFLNAQQVQKTLNYIFALVA